MTPPVSIETLSLSALMSLARRGFDALTRSAKRHDEAQQAERLLTEANRLLLDAQPNLPMIQAKLAEAESRLPTPSAELLRLKEVLRSAAVFAGMLVLMPVAPIAAVAAAAREAEAREQTGAGPGTRRYAKKGSKGVAKKYYGKRAWRKKPIKAKPVRHAKPSKSAKKPVKRGARKRHPK